MHCAAGYRASVAGSLLARAGRDVMVVSDPFSNAIAAGLTSSRTATELAGLARAMSVGTRVAELLAHLPPARTRSIAVQSRIAR